MRFRILSGPGGSEKKGHEDIPGGNTGIDVPASEILNRVKPAHHRTKFEG